MIFYNTNQKSEDESCLSRIKSFIKNHPYIFYGTIAGLVIIIVVIIVLCVTLTNKDEKEEEQIINKEIKIFPLEEKSRTEVMDIYDNIGTKDKGTYQQFCEYLANKGSNLKEEQKVYLAYYLIINNIKYDYDGLAAKTVSYDSPNIFRKRTTVCSGYSRLFRDLLLTMNYTKSKILNIHGYSKGAGYSSFKPPESNHEWNAVEINGKWCLIDTTWDAGNKNEYYLCTPPKCFVRDHLPISNDSLQFLDNPISLETFHRSIETREGFCKYNMEIIEDKAIQNICGRGKIIIKYSDEDGDDSDNYLTIASFNGKPTPAFFVNRLKNEFQIDLSVNTKGQSAIYLLMGYYGIGEIYFNCTEEPTEKFYFPNTAYHYENSDAQLISPIQRDLIKGQTYNFELRTNDFEEMKIYQGDDRIFMTKDGDIFKAENVYIHSDNIHIYSKTNRLVDFKGIGDDIDFPKVYDSPLNIRLYQPLIGTLIKGNEYKFEIKCESIEEIKIKIGEEMILMDRNNNIYTKTLTIDPSNTESYLYITYWRNLTNFFFDSQLYQYKLE